MRTTLRLTLAAAYLCSLGAITAATTSHADGGVTTDTSAAEVTCPKGTIKSTDDDGKVTCAKLTVVDPNARGHIS